MRSFRLTVICAGVLVRRMKGSMDARGRAQLDEREISNGRNWSDYSHRDSTPANAHNALNPMRFIVRRRCESISSALANKPNIFSPPPPPHDSADDLINAYDS